MEGERQKEKVAGWLFHPYEFAFCGYSGSGKTRVITTLIRNLSSTYKIGYVKHDMHGFQIDREGKDTYNAMSSGASSLLINDTSHFAEIHARPLDPIRQKISLLDSDMLFIEGYKNSKVPKFIFIDREQKVLKEFRESGWKNILGFVGAGERGSKDVFGYPYYHREDISGIQNRIFENLKERIENTPFFGLVLAGGKSSRMKREKSTLNYHGVEQARHCYKLLSRVCQKVFISSRKEQASDHHFKGLSRIHDQFLGFGPLGGILTAMFLHPEAAWLVLGCDLPFVDPGILTRLIEERDPLKMATAYIQPVSGFPQSLCTIYEPKIRQWFFQYLGLGYGWPLKDFGRVQIKTIIIEDGFKLDNVNTPEEFESALNALREGAGGKTGEGV